jgi:trans-aconitate methyltransferase
MAYAYISTALNQEPPVTLTEAITLIQHERADTNAPAHWADLGCGDGLFTQAISTFLPAGSTVYGVDKTSSLKKQTTRNGVELVPVKADFITGDLPFHQLDGVIMANALHYVKDKPAFLKKLQSHLQTGAPVILVEYDTDTAVPVWVPYPLSFASLKKLFAAAGYHTIRRLGEHPSIYGRSPMYAALLAP